MDWSKDYVAPLVLGATIIICAVGWGFRQHAFQRRALHVMGTVVSQYTQEEIDNGMSSYPVVEFKTEDGETVRFRGRIGTSGTVSTHATGKIVDVLYDPDDPAKAQVANFAQFWLMPLLMAIFGGIIFAVGLLVMAREGK